MTSNVTATHGENVGQELAQGPGAKRANLAAQHPHRPGAGLDQAHEAAQQGGLSRSVGPDEGRGLTGRKREFEAPQHRAVVEVLGQTSDGENRLCKGRAGRRLMADRDVHARITRPRIR